MHRYAPYDFQKAIDEGVGIIMIHKASEHEERLAFSLPSLKGGGAERVILTLASGFADHGFGVDLVLAKAEGPYLKDVPGNVHVVDLGKNLVIRSLPGLVAYLKRARPKAMLSAMEHANFVAIWAKKIARIDTRIIASVHSTVSKVTGGNVLKRLVLHQLLRCSYWYADRIVAVSKGVANDYIATMRLSNAQVWVIYNPAVRPAMLNKAKEASTHTWFTKKTTPIVLSVGRLTRAKDHPTLLRAMKTVCAETGVHLVISGSGSEITQTESFIKDLEKLLNDLEIRSLLDIPCGDLNWMQKVNLSNIDYCGADIVEELIKSNS